jgi:hypothetical protein
MALGRCLQATRAAGADGAAAAGENVRNARSGTVAVDGHRGRAEGAIEVCSIEAQTRSS